MKRQETRPVEKQNADSLSSLQRLLVALLVCFFYTGCEDNFTEEESQISKEQIDYSYNPHHDTLKRKFGQSLMNAVINEVGVRKLIKEEALKMFNNDYEVLYQMIKDQKVGSFYTFRDVLLKYSESQILFEEIESELPLLTILVPELPKESFSAETWDAETEIPAVALRIRSEEGVPILFGDEEEYLPRHLFPGFPVIVVKDNERVITTTTIDELTFETPGLSYLYKFTDANFDNIHRKSVSENIAARIGTVDQKLINAWNIMKPISGWQRDHIYYDLTATNTKGPFKADFKERITQIQFNSEAGYGLIAEQSGDPKAVLRITTSGTPPTSDTGWTDGYFEFIANALISSKTIGQPAIAPKFSARGKDLFTIQYELSSYKKCKWYQGCIGSDTYVWVPKSVTPKVFSLLSQKVDVVNWDLDKYAPTLVMTFQEVDKSQTITDKVTNTTEFVANFSSDQGIWKKIGLKLGGKGKVARASERIVVTSLESDNLGQSTVEFEDNVVDGNVSGSTYRTREYSTGILSFSIEPARVQNF